MVAHAYGLYSESRGATWRRSKKRRRVTLHSMRTLLSNPLSSSEAMQHLGLHFAARTTRQRPIAGYLRHHTDRIKTGPHSPFGDCCIYSRVCVGARRQPAALGHCLKRENGGHREAASSPLTVEAYSGVNGRSSYSRALIETGQ